MKRAKHTNTTQLTLSRETIRELADSKLTRVVGGVPQSAGTHCKTNF
jgi:hypothetical protein